METSEWIALGQMLTGMLGVGLVWLGLRQMHRAGDQREKREDARHREAMAAIDARHRETMRALDQQAEALRSLVKGMETAAKGMETVAKGMESMAKGLETVIERTAPRQ